MLFLPSSDMHLMSLLYEMANEDKNIQLSSGVSSFTLKKISSLVDAMNCYYSNLIEGVYTKVTDMDATMWKASSKSNENYLLAKAHIETARKFDLLTPQTNVFSIDYIRSLHQSFFSGLPDHLRKIKYPDGYEKTLIGGEFRTFSVSVGDHLAPSHLNIAKLMNEFSDAYSYPKSSMIGVLNALSSHHRFAWIHPFADGNGRTARLHTQAALIQSGIGVSRSWSISRGLARSQTEYYERLQSCDNLQESTLYQFVEFLAHTCRDQMQFMQQKINIELMQSAYKKLAQEIDMPKAFQPIWGLLIKEGVMKKSDIALLTSKTDRMVRNYVQKLLSSGLIVEGEGQNIELNLSPVVGAIVLPGLFPLEETIRAQTVLEQAVANPIAEKPYEDFDATQITDMSILGRHWQQVNHLMQQEYKRSPNSIENQRLAEILNSIERQTALVMQKPNF